MKNPLSPKASKAICESLEYLKLSRRALNALHATGIYSVAELVICVPYRLLHQTRNIDKITVRQIEARLRAHDLSLAMLPKDYWRPRGTGDEAWLKRMTYLMGMYVLGG